MAGIMHVYHQLAITYRILWVTKPFQPVNCTRPSLVQVLSYTENDNALQKRGLAMPGNHIYKTT